jgi:hypothetical protein
MGLLDWGLTDSDEEQRKRHGTANRFVQGLTQGLLGAPGATEEPSYMARVGRGMTDVGEGLAQAYYNLKVWDPKQADDYQKQRAEGERLYQKGLHADSALPEELQGMVPDFWRVGGQSAAMLPIWTAGGALRAGRGLYQAAVEAPIAAELWRSASHYPALLRYIMSEGKR